MTELGKREQLRESAWLIASLADMVCETSPHLDYGSEEALALLRQQIARLSTILDSLNEEAETSLP